MEEQRFPIHPLADLERELDEAFRAITRRARGEQPASWRPPVDIDETPDGQVKLCIVQIKGYWEASTTPNNKERSALS